MKLLRILEQRIHTLLAKRKLDDEMDEKMCSQVEMQTQENIANGMPPEAARGAALRQFGQVDGIKETDPDRRGLVWLESLGKDLRFAVRQLFKHKGSSLFAILILALGIGGTTAVYSVADKVLLHPIPGRHSDRLVTVDELDVRHGARALLSPPLIEELASHSNYIQSLTYFFALPDEKKLRIGNKTIRLEGTIVAPNFFDLLQLRPLAGRTFVAGEGGKGSGQPIILSGVFWQQYFGGDPHLIGRSIKLDEKSYQVVGVMPSNVQFPSRDNQFWIPHVFSSLEVSQRAAPMDRTWQMIARLHEGITLKSLQAMIQAVAVRRAPSVNQPNEHWTIEVQPARLSFTSQALQKTVWYLLAMLGALLLIACANVANLLQSRAVSRRGELAIRMAVGAGRFRIASQLLVESFALAGAAAALGVFIAWGGIIALRQFYLSHLPHINVIGLDWGVLGITCLVASLAGIFFGSVPAWLASRTCVNQSLKESAPQQSGGILQRAFHDGLAAIQVGLAVVLLAGAYLMVQSVVKLLRVDPGLKAHGLYRVWYDTLDFVNHSDYDIKGAIQRGVPKRQAYEEAWQARVAKRFAFERLALERIQAMPGVQSAAVNNAASFYACEVEGRAEKISLGSMFISVLYGDYLRTIGAEIVAGRLLSKEDASPGQEGVVINQKMATDCWPGENPLGKHFSRLDPKQEFIVVGVVENIEDWHLERRRRPVFYEPYERNTRMLSAAVGDYLVRSSTDARQLRAAMVQAGKEMMVPVELHGLYSIETELERSTAPRRVMMWLLVSLGGLGLLLSLLGVYAILAYAIARRTREVGIRMALGASRSQIRNRFFFQGMRLILDGLILGIVVAVAAGWYIKSLLFGIAPTEPWAFAAVALTVGLAGGLVCWLPARWAANTNPMEALRNE